MYDRASAALPSLAGGPTVAEPSFDGRCRRGMVTSYA